MYFSSLIGLLFVAYVVLFIVVDRVVRWDKRH